MNNHLHPLFQSILAPMMPPPSPAADQEVLWDFDWEHNDEQYQVVVYGYAPGIPADLSGPPEQCDPGDPSEIDWAILDEHGREVQLNLSYADECAIVERIDEHFREQAEAEEARRHDYDDDC
jgi:hypothetical protein